MPGCRLCRLLILMLIHDYSHAQSSENSHYWFCGLGKDPRGRRQTKREAVELVQLSLPANSQEFPVLAVERECEVRILQVDHCHLVAWAKEVSHKV